MADFRSMQEVLDHCNRANIEWRVQSDHGIIVIAGETTINGKPYRLAVDLDYMCSELTKFSLNCAIEQIQQDFEEIRDGNLILNEDGTSYIYTDDAYKEQP